MPKGNPEGTIISLQQSNQRLQLALRSANEAIKQMEAERQDLDNQRVSALSLAMCLLIEYHQGSALISIDLQNDLALNKFYLKTFPVPIAGKMRVFVTDDVGAPVEGKAGEDLKQHAIAKAAPAEEEYQRSPRCPECFLAFGEHRPGCTLAEQKPLPLGDPA